MTSRCSQTIRVLVLLVAVFALACVPGRQEMVQPVDDVISARLGKHVSWRGSDAEKDRAVDVAVKRILNAPLTFNGVVDVALVRNPGLQASYEGLGLAQADLVDAGLLDNPRVALSAIFDVQTGEPEVLASAELPFLAVLFSSWRQSMQEALRDSARAHVVDVVLQTAADVRRDFVRAVTAVAGSRLAHADVAAAEVAVLFARASTTAGNLSALDLALAEATFAEAGLAAADAEREATLAREDLAVALGLGSAEFILPALLPPLPAGPSVDTAALPARALEQNARLQARRAELDGAAQGLGYASASRFLPDLDVGAEVELRDAAVAAGPSLGIALPLLNLGQGEVLRRESRLRQAAATLRQDQVRLAARARQAVVVVEVTRRRLQQMDETLLPARDRVVDEMERRLNGMLITPAQLADAHRARTRARSLRAMAAAAAWIALIDAEQLAQGGTPPLTSAALMPSMSPSTSAPEH